MGPFLHIALASALLVLAPSASALVPSDPWGEAFETYEGAVEAYEAAYCGLEEFLAPEGSEPCPAVMQVDLGGETHYVATGAPGIFRESNGCAGLQQETADCDGDGRANESDDRRTLEELTGADLATVALALGLTQRAVCTGYHVMWGDDGPHECERTLVDGTQLALYDAAMCEAAWHLGEDEECRRARVPA